jgi:hypothetical protein
VLRRDAYGGRKLCSAVREAHGRGAPSVDAGVTLVERELERLGACPPGAERGLQIGYERVDLTASVDV